MAIKLSPNGTLDSYYNASRLLFHVYNQYFKTDGVSVYDLTNVEDAISGGEDSVLQNLSEIVSAHEKAIDVAQSLNIRIPLDLLFNTALVYTEVIEIQQDNESDNFDTVLEYGYKTQGIFQNLIELQTAELQKFLNDLNEIASDASSTNNNNTPSGSEKPPQEEEFTSEEVLQPSDVFETIISAYRLAQAVLENVSDPNSQIMPSLDMVNPFLSTCEAVADDLVLNFGERNNAKSDMISSITQDNIDDYQICKAYIKGLAINDASKLYDLWNNSELPHTPERYMLAADNIQTMIDRNDINLNSANSNQKIAEFYWKALTQMGNYYKQSQELLNTQLTEKKKRPSGTDDGIGSIISQISNIIIARSDIDLQRSQLQNYEPASKHKDVLFQNCKTFLKNAMNIANTTGGLRERITEKLQREKRKSEAVMRLCILENKSSLQELDSILGRQKWTTELPNLSKLGYFEAFGISNIVLPTEF
ncbi:uncharacterized protein AC631_00398 [Debaryomyces fabryi]|uniref:Uncharacterized protein n=1 Tax=Debaryomyces fabryi TaxID=58627 RepID=A0A0V1Q5L5_9ASCO|nr:uncharacterized protein AC631_00398 [Debaryomyces fabryi]KSA03763.1 hypothetical protein AC631_00398 [Debaryomyces fabryi]